MCSSSVSNAIYHKFSHGAAFYTLNGKNVNVKLEFSLMIRDGEDFSGISIFIMYSLVSDLLFTYYLKF